MHEVKQNKSLDKLLSQYKDTFGELGKMETEYDMKLKDDIDPIVSTARKNTVCPERKSPERIKQNGEAWSHCERRWTYRMGKSNNCGQQTKRTGLHLHGSTKTQPGLEERILSNSNSGGYRIKKNQVLATTQSSMRQVDFIRFHSARSRQSYVLLQHHLADGDLSVCHLVSPQRLKYFREQCMTSSEI